MGPKALPFLQFALLFLPLGLCDHHLLAPISDQCLREKEAEAEALAAGAFDRVAGIGGIAAGRVHDVSGDDIADVDLSFALWRRDDAGKMRMTAVTLSVDADDHVTRRREEDVTGTVGYDHHAPSRRTAELFVEDDGEAYLRVNTSDDATSCTLRLSSTPGAGNGRLALDDVFRFFAFSPDGQHVAYVAESHDNKNVALDGGFMGLRRPPTLFVYDVDGQSFRRLGTPRFAPGHLQWHPTKKALVGVAWPDDQALPTGFHTHANVANRLFLISLETEPPLFHLLSEPSHHRHYSSPRISPDGNTMIFLENDLLSSTTHPTFSPGPSDRSRRLRRASWGDVVDGCRNSSHLAAAAVTVVDAMDDGRQLADGSHFYGLYPLGPALPRRVFSAAGDVVYMTLHQSGDLRLAAVHLDSGAVVLRDEPGLVLLDVSHDVLLLAEAFLGGDTKVLYGRAHPDYLVTTQPPPTTTTTTTQDPCDTLLQELEMKGIVNGTESNHTHHHHNDHDHDNSSVTTAAPPPNVTTTPEDSIVLSRVRFVSVEALSSPTKLSRQELVFFDSPIFHHGNTLDKAADKTFFNAWVATPVATSLFPKLSKTLLVFLKDGPHTAVPRVHSPLIDAALSVGLSMLVVNNRGSIGMGDRSLEAIVGRVSEMDVSDCHEAIQGILKDKMGWEVVLSGAGYGGLVATTLAARHPGQYRYVVLSDPVVDLVALRQAGAALPTLVGRNYTDGKVFEDEAVLADAWNRSSLPVVDHIKSPSLFFVDNNNGLTWPASQGGRMHGALRKKRVVSDIYNLTNKGNTPRFMFKRTVAWLLRQFGVFEQQCQGASTTTPTSPVTGSPSSLSSSSSSPTPSTTITSSGAATILSSATFILVTVCSFLFRFI